MPAMPMADSRPPIVVGIRHTSSATITVDARARRPSRAPSGTSVTHAIRKMMRQPDEQDVQRDLVGRLLALRALDQARSCGRGTTRPGSTVMRTTMRSESTLVPPVTAERSPPLSRMTGRRLAGDRRLVHRGDAFDHLAVAGDELAGLDDHDVALAQRRARARARSRPSTQPARDRLLAQSRAARPPAPCRGPRPPPRRSWRTAP